jgi:uncharacterized repeat protein (TIGR01451 family)
MDGKRTTKVLFTGFAAIWLATLGCAQIRVPAIDPTGERIFAPGSTYTTLEPPCGAILHPSFLPRPAFSEPSAIPACASVLAGPPAIGTVPVQPRPSQNLAIANAPDRVMMTPSKIVAPVGSEVVLLAGLAGADGHFITKQPMEFLLSQESVGHLLDVGEDNHPHLSHLLHRSPEKQSSNFALARTAAKSRTITRGTPATGDDIFLQRGQSWVTLTSASEGTSHVTAVAARAENWEQRRQTATVHWVDAQWQLPSPAVVRAGQAHLLTTSINRMSDGAPVSTWIVRYTVISGPPVGFGNQRAQSTELPSGLNGKYSVSVQPTSNQPGATQIRIEILSPSLTGRDGQPVVVGQGTTTITWSAAGLAVRITGPQSGAVGATLNYQIEISNPGDLPADNVIVTAKLPPTLQPIGVTDGLRGGDVEWQIARLEAHGRQQFNLQCRAKSSGSIRLFAHARTASGVQSEQASLDTEIVQSALRLTMELAGVADPRQIRVGDQISYNVEVLNIGNIPLTNVRVRDLFDAGLDEASGERSPITKSLGNLAPGHPSRFAVTFNIRQAGELCHQIEVTADGGHATSDEKCIRVGQADYELSVEIHGPRESVLGETVNHEIVVSNTGDTELTGVRVVYRADESLLPKRATENFVPRDGALVWTVPSLLAAESKTFTVRCGTVTLDERAATRVSVSTTQGLTKATSLVTAIRQAGAGGAGPAEPAPRREPPRQPPIPQPPANGTLRLEVAATTGLVNVGDSATYVVVITNDRQVADKQVQVNLFLSEGLDFVNVTSDDMPAVEKSVSGQTVSVRPITEMRPGESITLRVDARARQAGEASLTAEAESQLSTERVVGTDTTPVQAN